MPIGRSSIRLLCALISNFGLSELLGFAAELLLGLSRLFRKLRILALNLIVVVGDRVDVEGLWGFLSIGLLSGCSLRLASSRVTRFASVMSVLLLRVRVGLRRVR